MCHLRLEEPKKGGPKGEVTQVNPKIGGSSVGYLHGKEIQGC